MSPQIAFESNSPANILELLIEYALRFDYIVDNSFGGFFAYALSSIIYTKPCILIKPCIPPDQYIPKLISDYPVEYVNELKKLYNTYIGRTTNYHLILGRQADVISPSLTLKLLGGNNADILDGGHRLSGPEFKNTFLKVVDEIENITN